MGIGNYTNLSELMNSLMETGQRVSISDLVREAGMRKIILASEGEVADKGDLENGFIALVDAQYRAGLIKPEPENDTECQLIELYKSGDLAGNGYGGNDGDLFLSIKWTALTRSLPVIANILQ